MLTGSPRWLLVGAREMAGSRRPRHEIWVESAFAPFVEAAGAEGLASKLRTLPIDETRSAAQYARLRAIKSFGGHPLNFSGGGFIARFQDSKSKYLCISDYGLDEVERDRLRAWANGEGFFDALLDGRPDEATFLYLAHNLKGEYAPIPQYMSKSASENLIDIIDDNYVGHDLLSMVSWYKSVLIFEIPQDNWAASANDFLIAARLAASHASYRPSGYPVELSTALGEIALLSNVNPENLYFALTSSHWKHRFIEIYKYLEAIFYLPWTLSLRNNIGNSYTALRLAKECRESLRWREQEENSIARIFSLLDEGIWKSQKLLKLDAFSDINTEKVTSTSISRRIYKIRNVLVHQEDYEDRTPITINKGSDWLAICSYMLSVVKALYVIHSADIDYQYEMVAGEGSNQAA